MNFPYYIVNAFGGFSYSGNPVGVCVLNEWLSTDELQKIASQACLSEMNFYFRESLIYGQFDGFLLDGK